MVWCSYQAYGWAQLFDVCLLQLQSLVLLCGLMVPPFFLIRAHLEYTDKCYPDSLPATKELSGSSQALQSQRRKGGFSTARLHSPFQLSVLPPGLCSCTPESPISSPWTLTSLKSRNSSSALGLAAFAISATWFFPTLLNHPLEGVALLAPFFFFFHSYSPPFIPTPTFIPSLKVTLKGHQHPFNSSVHFFLGFLEVWCNLSFLK